MNESKTPPKKNKGEAGASIDEQIADSFPASDPPSYNAGGRVGQPHRENRKKLAKAGK